MRKWIIAAVVLVVVVVAAVVAARNLESYLNNNREWLAQRAESTLGRKVSFERIEVSLARGLGVRVSDVAVADAPAFSDRELVRAKSAFVRVRLLPALFGRYEIANITLIEPVLSVVKTDAGYNFAALGKGEPQKETEGGDTDFTIGRFGMEDGVVNYLDRTAKPPVEMTFEQIDVSASDIGMDDPVEFELSAAALGSNKKNVRAEGEVGPLGIENTAEMPVDVEIELTDVTLDALARVKEIAAMLPAMLKTEGPLSLTADVDGTIGAAHIVSTLDADDAHVVYGTYLDKPAGVALKSDIDAKRAGETIDIERGNFVLGDARLDARGKVTTGEKSRYDVVLTSNAMSLGFLSDVVPALKGYDLDGTAELRNFGVAGAAGGKSAMQGSVALADVDVRGENLPPIEGLTTTATVNGDAVDFQPATFRLAGAPATLDAHVSSIEAQRATFTFTAATLPLSALGLSTEGESKDMRDVRVEGTLDKSALRIDPISAAAFGGKLQATANYAMQERPTFKLTSKVEQARVADLVDALSDAPSRLLAGVGDAEIELSGSGKDWEAIAPTLTGTGRVDVREGMIEDVNLVDGVLQGLTGFPGLSAMVSPEIRNKYPRLFSAEGTAFDELRANLRIAGQKLIAEPVALRTKEFSIDGNGDIGFDLSTNMNAVLALAPSVSKDLIGRVQLVGRLADQSGEVRIPFTLAGTMPNVKPRPNQQVVASALKGAAVGGLLDALDRRIKPKAGEDGKAKAGAGEDAETKDSKGHVGDEIRRGIEGLFGR